MSELVTEALAAAQRRGDELLPLLRTWVETNSFSGNVDGVNAMAQLLLAGFDLPGLEPERRPGTDVGDHLVWRTKSWSDSVGRRILLVGHHDTVFPPATFDVWETDGDRLRGPGVLDMKGGLAIIRTAVAALADAGALDRLPLAVISVGDEEIGSLDSRPFLEELARGARAALVFEAGRVGDKIITRRKGTGRFQVKATGLAAHAGNHHSDGVSAIRAMARFVEAIEQMTDYDRGITVNVGLIGGGTSANTVPAEATCAVDFRYIRTRDGEELVAAVDQLGREIGASSRATFSITGGIRRSPLERSDASGRLYRRYATCAENASLGTEECELIGGGSDANTVSAIGVPAIDGLGPRGRGFHTHDEYIEISSLALRVDALVRMLLSYDDNDFQ